MQIKDHKHLPAKFLIDQTTSVTEAEQAHLVQTPLAKEPIAFGYLHNEWNKIKRKMKSGDELRYFRTTLCTGIALIQNNRIVDFMLCGIPD